MEKVLNFLSGIIPIYIICISIIYGLMENKNIFEFFKEGVYKGIKTIYTIFPTLIGLFVAINILNESQIIKKISYVLVKNVIPEEMFSLLLIRCISGSAALANFDLVISEYGGNSKWTIMAAIVLGSTETVIYTVMMYSSVFKNKKYKILPLILFGLIGNLCAVLLSYLWIKKFF